MSHNIKGLSSVEAAGRLKVEGYNELPAVGKRSVFHIIVNVFGEPMFALLLVAAGVYFVIGDFQDALILSVFALISVFITIVQEWRSERVLEALRDLTSPRALVERDGQEQKIEGRYVVSGDVLILAEGDRIPADARLISPDMIMTDESLLTGESVPVNKRAGDGERGEMIFSGTLIVRGSAKAVVTATGTRSEIGKIGKSLGTMEIEPPRLRQQTKKIVLVFGAFALVLSLGNILLFGLLRDNWMDGLLGGIALGMSLLPEEFPLVLTVFMVMGAWRISKLNVLTRQGAAIETLGSATVLCTDKTGTLTQNKMTISYMKCAEDEWRAADKMQMSPEIYNLLSSGMRASKMASYDPMDMAFFDCALHGGQDIKQADPEFHYGLHPKLLMMAQIFQEDGLYKVYAKGAPEVIAKACCLDSVQMEAIYKDVEVLGQSGVRVLAVAVAEVNGSDFPQSADGFSYRFLGLVGFSDPLREKVPAAVSECRNAGIRIIMITGDYPATAQAIARQAGIDAETVLTGDMVKAMDDLQLQDAVRVTHVFARITPDQKLRIVTALKENGDVVAMTGDGVNDAPSLKAAHIGVAMGKRGTDVAREAAAIVLLDDDFSSLVRTIALGRRIYDNLQKAMVYIVAVHIPIAGLAMLPLVFGKPLILTPLLIALMEMVIDPACSVVLEAERSEKNIMKRPPRNPLSPLLSSVRIGWGCLQGGVAFLALWALWFLAVRQEMQMEDVRSFLFVSLMMMNLALILVNRTFSSSVLEAFKDKNPFLGWGILGMSCFFALILFLPMSQHVFGLGDLRVSDFVVAMGAAFGVLVVLELLKPLFVRQRGVSQ